MPFIYVPFWVEPEILDGLQNGSLERKGGVIRNSKDKKIVCWLKQEGEIPDRGDISSLLFKIIAGAADVEGLSDIELIELGTFINGNKNLSSFNFYQGSKGPVDAIVGKYNRLMSQGKKDEAMAYAAEKRKSLVNIFARTYIPNLKHQVELKMINMVYDEKTGLTDFVGNVE